VIGFRKSRLRPSFLPRWLEWTTFALFVLFIGPAIGGVVAGIFGSIGLAFNMEKFHWSIPVFAIGVSVAFGYYSGSLIAAPALVIFAFLAQLFGKGSMFLAIASGILSAIVVLPLHILLTGKGLIPITEVGARELGVKYVVSEAVALTVISAITAAICWHMTKPLHKLP
jgi:hypothetical protein